MIYSMSSAAIAGTSVRPAVLSQSASPMICSLQSPLLDMQSRDLLHARVLLGAISTFTHRIPTRLASKGVQFQKNLDATFSSG